MSATAVFISGPTSLTHFREVETRVLFHYRKTLSPNRVASNPSQNNLFLRNSSYGLRRRPTSNPIRPFSPVMEWQDCSSVIEVDVPCSVAYDCYSDRETIPKWMPFISSVEVLTNIFASPFSDLLGILYSDRAKKRIGGTALYSDRAKKRIGGTAVLILLEVLKDKPDLSRWSLKYEVFGRDVQFSWLARNMQPIPNQKIHWRSLEGLPNRWRLDPGTKMFLAKPDFTIGANVPCQKSGTKMSHLNKQIHYYNPKLGDKKSSRKRMELFVEGLLGGAVRFFPKGPSSCRIELTVSYEIPQILIPVASALKPFLESLLSSGLDRFAAVARDYQRKISQR